MNRPADEVRFRRFAAGALVTGALLALAVLGYTSGTSIAGYYYCVPYGYQYCPPEPPPPPPPPAHLIVIKHVINDNDGSSVASDFTMTIVGVIAEGGNSFPGEEPPGTDKVVTPGNYTVTEEGPLGYVAFFSPGCTGSISAGQTKTCTVTNNDIAPRLTVGYWKSHEAETTALLPQTLGTYPVPTFQHALAVFNAMNCSLAKGDAVSCLAGQLLAAKLNLANASDPCIQPTVTNADRFLSGLTVTVGGITVTGIVYTGPGGTYTLSSDQRQVALFLKDALDKYNNNKRCVNP